MMTIEIKINGCLISHVYAVNHSTLDIINHRCMYDCFFTRTDRKSTKSFKITHDRDDGAEVLAEKILKEIVK